MGSVVLFHHLLGGRHCSSAYPRSSRSIPIDDIRFLAIFLSHLRLSVLLYACLDLDIHDLCTRRTFGPMRVTMVIYGTYAL